MTEIRAEFAWLDADPTVVLAGPDGEIRWWTFGGAGANASLSQTLSEITRDPVTSDSFAVAFAATATVDVVETALRELRHRAPEEMRPAVAADAIDGLKFSESLPRDLALRMLQTRLLDVAAVRHVLAQLVRIVHGPSETAATSFSSDDDLSRPRQNGRREQRR